MSMAPRGYDIVSTLSPQQQSIFDMLQSNLSGQMGGAGLDKLTAPYMRQYQENIVPGLAERFAGLGAGSQSSSAFRQALGGSAADLGERLASLGFQHQQNVQGQLMNLLGLNTQALLPQQKPWWQEALIGAGSGLGQGLGALGGSAIGGGAGLLIKLLQSLLQKG